MRIADVFCLGFVMFAACSKRVPSVADARPQVEEIVRSKGADSVRLESFEKTDGQRDTVDGTGFYVLEFKATLKVEKECMREAVEKSRLVFKPLPSAKDLEFLVKSFGRKQLEHWRPGDFVQVMGKVAFDLKESGWGFDQATIKEVPGAMPPAGYFKF